MKGFPQRNRGPAYKRKHHWMWWLARIKPASQSHPPDVTGVLRWEERSFPRNYHPKKTFLKMETQCVTHISALAALPLESHMVSCIFAFIYTTKCCVCCVFLVGKCSAASFYFLPHRRTKDRTFVLECYSIRKCCLHTAILFSIDSCHVYLWNPCEILRFDSFSGLHSRERNSRVILMFIACDPNFQISES